MAEILNHYQGEATPETIEFSDGTIILPYLPDPGLIEAVNLAIELRRPLLIMGEPGCGKTKLAQAVAYELNKDGLEAKEVKWKDIYFEWHVKSLSKAREGLYRFDYIERLQDAQLDKASSGETSKLRSEPEYIKRGPLGLAFEATNKTGGKVVVLIDEIDKADPDFPNDLLRELDEMKYTVEELDGEKYPDEKEKAANPKNKPIVIITSNDEKELPVAFLRRCLFYHIDFPEEDQLRRIVAAHFTKPEEDPSVLKAVETFMKTRKRMEAEKEERAKKPSTSELIDWCRILLFKTPKEIEKLLEGELPYRSILFKEQGDILRFSKAHLEE
ncbi:MAG: MoxR family ATPase [Lewinellaceae bacterium]|nr:MoxR family ATPase [Phaeodactylibacter sp.]MCB9035898.1 MoxR family ATPase [Lewinellaceae bacterium]